MSRLCENYRWNMEMTGNEKERYYRLSDHCRWIKGAHGSAIYDLYQRKVFSLNLDATIILDEALSGRLSDDNESFLFELCQKKLLNCSDHIICESMSGLILRYVWLELTNQCNCRCIHCYGAFGVPKFENQTYVTTEKWFSVIDQIKQYHGNAIQFIGGEPILHPDFCKILRYAADRRIGSIDIFTNGTLVDEHILQEIKKANASVRVSLYGYDSASHDGITQHKGSFQKLDRCLDLLREQNIPTRIAVVMMKENQDCLDRIISYIESKGHVYSGFDTVRQVKHSAQFSHAVTDSRIAEVRCLREPEFQTCCDDYFVNSKWNSCWYGKAAITATGDVIPCIFARDKVCGNILSDEVDQIKEKLVAYWKINKDSVEVCKDCEYRYACDDCRPLAEGETGDFYAKNPRCFYNPYTGCWNDHDPDRE